MTTIAQLLIANAGLFVALGCGECVAVGVGDADAVGDGGGTAAPVSMARRG